MAAVVVPTADASCLGADPADTARNLFRDHRAFAFQVAGEDLRLRKAFLSPDLYDLLRAEWRCQDLEQGICSLDSDPWLNAQDGEVIAPVRFVTVVTSAARASVAMRFRFQLNAPESSVAEATLSFVKGASGCWLLDDLVGREGRSLKKQLQEATPPNTSLERSRDR